MTTAQDWVAGARPRTLWTAISPVAVGTGAAVLLDGFRFLPALLALAVGLAIQIAVNYANDYSDGVRGTDMDRVGPDRLVATGKATPTAVRNAAFLAFGVAAIAGLALVAVTDTWWLLIVGAIAIVAAWGYTGTSRPYGYSGWGEVVAFVFFGPVATLGTLYTQTGRITWWAVVASVGVGLYSVALMLVNNIRDIETDTVAGKRTLPVRVGEARARRMFMSVVLLPVVCAVVVAFVHPWALIATVVALPSLLIAFAMRVGAEKISMPLIFKGISGIGLAYGLLLGLGLAL
ncbi:1,4-dihydroxy-2-naphthoate polyprenyltransferase [Demequina litorisediminis]|uniref:1,4-dihydroxy-2-naphthoate octaprenyltransferase n=1 Tax=Demequina litorisediminis TaxID=1849022 RepID=A0ABQ6IEF3_9MICO|nr:1,4-dihydroxy-2-naphthoate polyprenyltransferase [Demequina litorisediminis]GMA36071.1 1,4-dihydroxy-2-naphthoate octaprenyltransferase [Demequina litorisediminis]